MFVASAGLLPVGAVSGQSHADSVSVMRALGRSLRDEARRVLTVMTCYERRYACPAPRQGSPDVLMAELARAAGAALVSGAREAVSPCPWGYDPARLDAGFVVGIGGTGFSVGGDTAHVLVLEKCDNPPGYLHDIFARDFEYQLARRPSGEWNVIGRRLTRIT
jgi:hypothetical protein